MCNDRLSMEEVRERIAQRMQEVETYASHQRLGFSDHGVVRWVIAFTVIVIAIIAIGLFL